MLEIFKYQKPGDHSIKDRTWTRLLAEVKKVEISFKVADKPECNKALAWTERDKPTFFHNIYVNMVLKDRIDSVLVESDEYKIIVVGVGFSIFHEIAHLLLRWQDVEKSPVKFGCEVGRYLEERIFEHDTYLVGYKRNMKAKWSKDIPIIGIV
jgi:hypothetical protein